MTRYRWSLPFEVFEFEADLDQASATIYTVDEDGQLVPTQYQTADAGHDAREALRLCLEACGPAYWHPDGGGDDEEEVLADLVDSAGLVEEECDR